MHFVKFVNSSRSYGGGVMQENTSASVKHKPAIRGCTPRKGATAP